MEHLQREALNEVLGYGVELVHNFIASSLIHQVDGARVDLRKEYVYGAS